MERMKDEYLRRRRRRSSHIQGLLRREGFRSDRSQQEKDWKDLVGEEEEIEKSIWIVLRC